MEKLNSFLKNKFLPVSPQGSRRGGKYIFLGKVSKQPLKYERMVAWDRQSNARDAGLIPPLAASILLK
jgi:hypothetical protein